MLILDMKDFILHLNNAICLIIYYVDFMVLGPNDIISANIHVQRLQDQVLCKRLFKCSNVQERFMIYLSVYYTCRTGYKCI